MKSILLVLALACSASYADTATLGGHMLSFHRKDGFRTVTPGIYAMMENGATGGIVRNSEGNTSAYLGYTMQTKDTRFALTLGGISGYSKRLRPMAIPSVKFNPTHDIFLRVSYLAKPPGTNGSDAIHLSLETPFATR